MLYHGMPIAFTALAIDTLDQMPEQEQSPAPRAEKDPQRPIIMNMTMSDWLKLAGYIIGLVLVWFQMDGRVHSLELMVAEMRTETANYERADLSKVRSEGLSDQLREITRRLGTIETKVDNIETKK